MAVVVWGRGVAGGVCGVGEAVPDMQWASKGGGGGSRPWRREVKLLRRVRAWSHMCYRCTAADAVYGSARPPKALVGERTANHCSSMGVRGPLAQHLSYSNMPYC
ncbi:hypothetical protein PLESTB_001433000 [Pleodorina starrii]|uniref:Uncharacterized protein n=1 Tax=Pleodorina starrii TaxID=330485 RepID=A0A9W6BV63_9CHLO|nr:hypothetical protein PLESTM_001391800 [Pleodorina starrii]GLC59014.1 hypothetical protein PLESTB_001433000 [Pleodorina starrii]GLC67636.1 hypothetical protein PLESTF_000585300 [Pleodorina starrii]